jgi:hypothetical protein
MFMREITYAVRGFLTVRKASLRVPLTGSLAVRADPGSGRFTGDLVLHPSAVTRTVFGARLFSATVQVVADSPVTGAVDHQGRMSATVAVEAVITAARAAGRTFINGGSCRTAPRPSCRCAPGPVSIWNRAVAWPAGTAGRPSPGAAG